MKFSADIRELYKPVQPTVKESADNVTYSEFLPDIKLQSYIYCYWQLKTTKELSEQFIYRVVADGCIDIFLELNNAKDSFVMGFCKKFTEFPLDNSFHYIGVRFLPTIFPQLFKIDASELSNRFEQLGNVVPQVSAFIADNFHHQLTTEQIQKYFDSYFIKLIESTNCMVHTPENKKVVVQGLDGYIIAEKDNTLLICKLTEEQRIKEFSKE